jgi:hypothetical protein
LEGYFFDGGEGFYAQRGAVNKLTASLYVEQPMGLDEIVRILCESDEPYNKHFKISGVACSPCFRPRFETDRCLGSDEISKDCIRTMIEYELRVASGAHDMELLELTNGRYALVYKREWVFPDWMQKAI